MVDAQELAAYFEGNDPRLVLDGIARGERTDPISERLADGLRRVRKEGEPDCFTFPETWRFATRSSAAKARLGFLSEHVEVGAVIIDASCGIGLMLRELAQLEPSELHGFEIDPIAAELAKANLRLFGIEAQIHVLDANSPEAARIMHDAGLVFCDPERVASASERSLDENEPSYETLRAIAPRLAYEVSPRVDLDGLPQEAVIELYSQRRRHARTTIYSGFGVEPKRRVVSDRGERVEGTSQSFEPVPLGAGSFFELLDPTIVTAGLAHRFGAWHASDGRHVRFADERSFEPFIDGFSVIADGEREQVREAARALDDFERVVLRYSVGADQYWRESNTIRPSGKGTRTYHLFRFDERFVLCEPIP